MSKIKLKDITNMFPEDNGDSISVDEKISDLVFRLAEVQREIKLLKNHEELLKMDIMQFMQENAVMKDERGNELVTWQSQIKNSLDTTRIKEELPDIYEKYLKTQVVRVFKNKI
jgi:predicted phage-related endonuclease